MDTQPQTYDVRPWPVRLEERIARLEDAVRRLADQRPDRLLNGVQQNIAPPSPQPIPLSELYVVETWNRATGHKWVSAPLPLEKAQEVYSGQCSACDTANYQPHTSWNNQYREVGGTWKAAFGVYISVSLLRCDRVGSEMLK